MTEQFTVDAVIPVLNGFPEIRDCVEGLLHQSVRIRRIIALDSGSTDGTLDYLKGIEEVVVVPVPAGTFNHGLTRNLGWQHSDADLLFYTVQDARTVHRDVVAELIKPFMDPAVAGVCGRQIVCRDPRHNPVEWFRPVSEPQSQRYQLSNAAAFDAMDPEVKRSMCGWDNVAAMYRRSVMADLPFRDRVFGRPRGDGKALVYRRRAASAHRRPERRRGGKAEEREGEPRNDQGSWGKNADPDRRRHPGPGHHRKLPGRGRELRRDRHRGGKESRFPQ